MDEEVLKDQADTFRTPWTQDGHSTSAMPSPQEESSSS